MSALSDVQRALNAIREITSKEQAAVRLGVLRLLATAIADEASDIKGVTAAKPKRAKPPPALPIPKSTNVPKSPQVAPKQQQKKRKPNSLQPIKPIKPIAPK